jgi:replicative DNA helicase
VDIEKALISRAASGGLIETLVTRGIGTQHFESEANKAVFNSMIDHVRQYRAVPSLDVVQKENPSYGFLIVEDSIEYLIDEFVKKVKRRLSQQALYDIAQRVDDKDEQANLDLVFLEHSRALAQAIPTTRASKFSEMPNRIELYNELLRTGVLPGVPTGIPTIDSMTLGIQPHEFVVVAAFTGVGKSTLLQYIAFNAYLAGKTPLFMSLEMEAEALHRKFDTMATNFEYRALRALELGEGDMRKWEEWGEKASSAKNDIIVIDDMSSCTVERVYAETARYKPDCVMVDYIQLMDAPVTKGGSDYNRYTQITRGLKMNARQLKVPLFAAAQTNRDAAANGVKKENIGDSISIVRDADILIGLDRTEEMEQDNEMYVRLVKNRDGKMVQVTMDWDPSNGRYSEKSTFQPKATKLPGPGQVSVSSEAKKDGPVSNDPALKKNPFE